MRILVGIFSNNPEIVSDIVNFGATAIKSVNVDLEREVQSISTIVHKISDKQLRDYDKAMRKIFGKDIWMKASLKRFRDAPDGVYLVSGITTPEELDEIFKAKVDNWVTETWLVNDLDLVKPIAGYAPSMIYCKDDVTGYNYNEFTRNYPLTEEIREATFRTIHNDLLELKVEVDKSPNKHIIKGTDFSAAKKVYPIAGQESLNRKYY